MKSKIEKQQDGTIKLDITIPAKDIAATKDQVVEEYVKTAQIPGFRKGKAPKKAVEDKIDKQKLNEEVLRKLLPKFYVEAVTEHKLNPILNPKIHVHEIKNGEDWAFEALTCEAPIIDLGNYKDSIKKLTAKTKIVIPGKEQQQVSFDDVVKELLASVKITVPQIIIDQEVDRLLAQSLDEIKKLGLTLEQYLGSTGKTAVDLRKEYQTKAVNDVTLEFALQKIADSEKIVVEEKEVEEAINQAKSDAEKQNLQANRYLLSSIIRQQKTLDFLRNL